MTDYRGLPKEYIQLEYIQSSGTQYIDTGITPNQDTAVMMDAEFISSVSGTGHIFGANSSTGYFTIRTNSKNNGFAFRLGKNVLTNVSSDGTINSRHIFKLGAGKCQIDDSTPSVITNTSFSSDYTIIISALNQAQKSGWSSLKIYSFKLEKRNTSLDLCPAKRTSDGAIGMYDMVSKKFFANAGSGSFTAGAEVKKRAAAYVGAPSSVQLIESNVGTYFDTSNQGMYSYWGNGAFHWYLTSGDSWVAKEDTYISFNYDVKNNATTILYNFYINSEFICIFGTSDHISTGKWSGYLSKGDILSLTADKNTDITGDVISTRAPERGATCTLTNIQISTPSMPSVARKIKKAYVGVGKPKYQMTQYPYEEDNYLHAGLAYGMDYIDNERIEIRNTQPSKTPWSVGAYGETKQIEIEITSQLPTFVMSCTEGTPSEVRGMGTFTMVINCLSSGSDVIIDWDGSDTFPEDRRPVMRVWITPKTVARKIKKAYVGVPVQIKEYAETKIVEDTRNLYLDTNSSNIPFDSNGRMVLEGGAISGNQGRCLILPSSNLSDEYNNCKWWIEVYNPEQINFTISDVQYLHYCYSGSDENVKIAMHEQPKDYFSFSNNTSTRVLIENNSIHPIYISIYLELPTGKTIMTSKARLCYEAPLQIPTDLESISWAQLHEAANTFTHDKLAHLIGMTKNVTVNGKVTPFQLIGIGQDEAVDGTDVLMTFQCKDCLPDMYIMHPSAYNNWGSCKMRTYLHDKILNQFDTDTKAAIVPVKKKYTINRNGNMLTSNDTLWLASEWEIFGSTSFGTADEGNFYEYWSKNNNSTARIKKRYGSADAWWERSIFSSTNFCAVYKNGDAGYYNYSTYCGVVPCFCI